MLDLIQITNDPAFARRCDALAGIRLWIDLERLGKAQRQAGRATFISTHVRGDVGRIKQVLHRSRLMVRVNPINPASAGEVDAVLAEGADMLMLPMFTNAGEVAEFSRLVDGRSPIVALLETAQALGCLDQWIATPGLAEVFVGLNDLHISLGHRFMFEPLASGHVERVAAATAKHGLRFGFGGIARLDEGQLPGRDVLAEHVRLGSASVILSRTFHRGGAGVDFEDQVAALREAEARYRTRDAQQAQADACRIVAAIRRIGASPIQGSTP